MKKRAVCWLLTLVMVLSLLPFSAMAQVYPVTGETKAVAVQFLKGEEEISTQRVSNVGRADGKVPYGALYDPGCPVVDQEVFLGWQIDGQTGTVPVDAEGDAASVRKYVNDNYAGLAGKTLKVHAVIGQARYLVYMDENDRVLKSEALLASDDYKTTVDLEYVPTDAAMDFFGWTTTKGATDADYQNGEEITLSAAKTTLYPVVKQGFWLSFETNVKQDDDPTKASFAAPQFYATGDQTAAPDPAPTRPGYQLEGWYDDAALTQKHTFGAISGDQTVYAKWEPKGTVEYQVIIWKQKTTDDPNAADADKTYDYAAGPSETRRAQAGSTVSITNDDTRLARSATRNITMGTNEKWNFFTYNAAKSDTESVTVNGDGSTVLNVYYDRVPITINFWTNSSTNEFYYDGFEDGRPSYTYNDPWATGYYMIGKDGPLGADWKPENGTIVYSFNDMRKDSLSDSYYQGRYFESTSGSPDASYTYTANSSSFTWSGGALFHQHNFYFIWNPYFAQFYYYENQSGTYYEGEGPEADIDHGGTATSGTHYYYNDPFATGYYRIGMTDGPFEEGYLPQRGDRLYYVDRDGYRTTSLNSTLTWPKTTESYSTNRVTFQSYSTNYSRPSDGSVYLFDGGLYYYNNAWIGADYFYPLYASYTSKSGYYEVGTGPDPTAPGTASVKKSSYTGLYGAKFDDWIVYNSSNQPIEWKLSGGSYYPMPVRMFDNAEYGSASSGQASTLNFYPSDTASGYTVHYQGQTVDGSGYEDFITFLASGSWRPTEQFVGFTIKEYRRGSSGAWNPITSTQSFDVDRETWVHFTRHQNHFVMTSNNADVLDAELYYEAPLIGYSTSDYVPTNGPAGAYFDGWYADPGFTTPFDFNTTMPDNDVRIYAKWTTMRFRVLLDPTNGDDSIDKSTISFGENNQVTSFRLDYGEKIEKSAVSSATRTEGGKTWQLIGWYSDPELTHPFSFDFSDWSSLADFGYSTAPDSERQGVDFWNENAPWNDADGEHDDVVGKVTIYAKWRQVMDPGEYIRVEYDAGEGTLTTSDDNHYADQAQAIALPAPVPPTGYTFSHWQVLGADGNPTVDVDTGHTFEVKLDDADANKVVKLVAVYNSSTTTHITWFGNGGTTADGADTMDSPLAQLNAETNIMPADTFQRDGYIFLGWARLNESDMQDGETWKQTDSDSAADAAKQSMFLTWNVDEEAFHVNSALDSSFPAGDPVATAVSANELQPYHVLYAVWQKIETVTYVADFNAKMKLAENAAIADAPAPVEKNGDFTVDNSKTAYYQFNQLSSDKKLVNGGVSLAFDGVDSARITGKFYAENTPAVSGKAAAASTTTKNVNVVPASSVYFDDDLVNETVTVGDGSGYNASVQASSPDAVNVKPGVYRFTFTGTGIDIYCTTYTKDADGTEPWYAQAKVDNGAVQTMLHQSNTVRYNIPTLSFRDLPYGEHTLVLNITSATNYKLDGIRVYGAVEDQSVYADTHEDYATYISMRETLVNKESTYNAFTNEMTEEQIGSLFVDNAEKMALWQKPISGRTGQVIEDAEPVQVYKDKFDAYKKNGPKHEIYLAKNEAIVFALTQAAYNAAAAGDLWIGLSAPDKDTGTGTVTLVEVPKVQKIDVTSGVDMYYPITKDMIGENNVVTIKNTGDTMISITNLKITGNKDIYDAAHPAAAPGSETPDTTANPTRVFEMVFAPVTMTTVKVAANGGVDPDAVFEPDVPEQPEVPDMPAQPSDPTDPTDPSTTEDPTDPSATVTPSTPDDPTDPTDPSTPSVPTEPGTNDEPAASDTPNTPSDPGTPSSPETPDAPEEGKSGWNNDAYDPVSILRALFKLLMQSLSSLFNGLGDW